MNIVSGSSASCVGAHPLGEGSCAGARGPSRLPFGASLLSESSLGGLDRPLRAGRAVKAEGTAGKMARADRGFTL